MREPMRQASLADFRLRSPTRMQVRPMALPRTSTRRSDTLTAHGAGISPATCPRTNRADVPATGPDTLTTSCCLLRLHLYRVPTAALQQPGKGYSVLVFVSSAHALQIGTRNPIRSFHWRHWRNIRLSYLFGVRTLKHSMKLPHDMRCILASCQPAQYPFRWHQLPRTDPGSMDTAMHARYGTCAKPLAREHLRPALQVTSTTMNETSKTVLKQPLPNACKHLVIV